MSFLHNLAAKIKARKGIIAYSAIALILAAILAGMVMIKLSNQEQHMVDAADNGQLVVFDLTTSEEVDVNAIFKTKADHKPAGKKPAEKEHAAQPAMPIKQTDVMFIINNLGANKTDTERAIQLPAPFMLSFSPYAELSLELSQAARAKGHITLVDLPVQSKDSTEAPGNLALMIDNNDFKNSRNFEAALSKVYQPSGVLTPPNDLFTHSTNFNATLQQIAQHKVYLAYAGEGDEIDAKAKDTEVGLLKIDLIINDSDKPEDIAKQLASVETLISKTGLAVVMIKSPSTPTIDIIAKWAETLPSKNIHLISSQK